MPVVRNRMIVGIARGMNAFVKLDAGIVRGSVTDPDQQLGEAQSKLAEQNRRIEQLQKRLNAKEKKPKPSSLKPAVPEEKAFNQLTLEERAAQREPGWHRRLVGKRWDEMGGMQFSFLKEHGLQPEHHFLDVGCGSLRGGVQFIPYLEPGHYYGIDINQDLIDAGRIELGEEIERERKPTLVQMEDFGFERLDQKFDYALAQSVFTHLPLNIIARCLINMDRVLKPGGTFFATFFENPGGKHNLEPVEQGDGVRSHYDRDPFHYSVDAFERICDGTGLEVEYIGDWKHPRHQYMLAFHKGNKGSLSA